MTGVQTCAFRSPDRNAQFEHINAQVLKFQRQHQPVVSVDTKKKDLVGEFKNAGQEWQPKGEPEKVNVHDFPGRRSRPDAVFHGLCSPCITYQAA